MASCKELRRIRRELLIQRMVPGLVAMAGLLGSSIPIARVTYDIDDEWRELADTADTRAT